MIKAIAVAVGGEAKTVASVLLSLSIHRFSFRNKLFDPSAGASALVGCLG